MRIDAHQHFWRYQPEAFGWLDGPLAPLRQDFGPPDLRPLLAAIGIEGTVAVQARQCIEETRWLLDLAREHPFIRGVVGWVPLADSRINQVLETFAAEPRLKGVRHVVQGEAPGFLDAPAFNAGLRAVTARGLTYDILVFARQLEEVIRFVDRHPQQAFVLDHIAKPIVQSPPSAAWLAQLRDLARREHIYCKFSGVVTEVPGLAWTPALVKPYFDEALAAFGPNRLMFGSDWPVCLPAAGYANWHAFVTTCVAALSATEQAAIFGGNAARFYKL